MSTTMKYCPYGDTRSGSVSTDKLFTGQRLDDTRLYYYGARYYDAEIGRFISAGILISIKTNLITSGTSIRIDHDYQC